MPALMRRALAGAYAMLVLALAWGVWVNLHLRCEGFGCMGLGVAWFAWAIAFAVVLGLGALARAKAGPTAWGRLSTAAWRAQWLLGAGVLLMWGASQLR